MEFEGGSKPHKPSKVPFRIARFWVSSSIWCVFSIETSEPNQNSNTVTCIFIYNYVIYILIHPCHPSIILKLTPLSHACCYWIVATSRNSRRASVKMKSSQKNDVCSVSFTLSRRRKNTICLAKHSSSYWKRFSAAFKKILSKKKMDGQLSFEYSLQVNTILIPPLWKISEENSVSIQIGEVQIPDFVCVFYVPVYSFPGLSTPLLVPCFLSKPSTHSSCLFSKESLCIHAYTYIYIYIPM